MTVSIHIHGYHTASPVMGRLLASIQKTNHKDHAG